MALLPAISSSASLETNFHGSYKSILSYRRVRPAGLFPQERDGSAEQRLRAMARANYGVLLAEYAHEASFFVQSRNEPFGPLPALTPPPAWEASWQPIDEPTYDLFHRIDRAFIQFSPGDFELVVGKQVVATGVGRIFQAVSQVPRLPFVVVDPEYPRTEDAVTAVWKGKLGLEGRFLPKARGQERHSFHVRAKTQVGQYDTAITTGRSDEKEYIGLEAAGSLGDSVLRGEAVAYHYLDRIYTQTVAGFDTVFNAEWSGGIEVFYNGFDSVPHRPNPYRAKWYAGGSVTWEASARWKFSLFTLVNLVDPSALLNPAFSYSIATDMDLIGGQFVSLGNPSSEFLGLPDLTYLALRVAF